MENRVEIKDKNEEREKKNEEREKLEEFIAKIKQSPAYVLYLLNEEERHDELMANINNNEMVRFFDRLKTAFPMAFTMFIAREAEKVMDKVLTASGIGEPPKEKKETIQ